MLHISVVVALGAAAEAAIGAPAYRLLSTIEHGSAAIVVGENGKTNVNDPKRVCTYLTRVFFSSSPVFCIAFARQVDSA
jgi:hypothetical protein